MFRWAAVQRKLVMEIDGQNGPSNFFPLNHDFSLFVKPISSLPIAKDNAGIFGTVIENCLCCCSGESEGLNIEAYLHDIGSYSVFDPICPRLQLQAITIFEGC